jgi:hypothetical protein
MRFILPVLFLMVGCLAAETNSTKRYAWINATNIDMSNKAKPPKRSKYRVVIANLNPAFIGEIQALKRIAKAVGNLGWEWILADDLDKHPECFDLFKPDFVISAHSDIKPISKKTLHLLYIHHKLGAYLDKSTGALNLKRYQNLLKYDGFLQVTPNIQPVINSYEKATGKNLKA